jgi:thymidylate kinase
MIFALEGPDGCGKTTLYRRLRQLLTFDNMRFVNWGPVDRELWDQIHKLEQRDFILFSSMYDRASTYICDRFFIPTGSVYARVYNRPIPVYRGPWEPGGLVVCYLRVPQEVALQRMTDRGDMSVIIERHARIHQEYEAWVAGISTHQYQTHILDGTRPIDALVVDFQRIMRHHGLRVTYT